jgi:hypothetical protein
MGAWLAPLIGEATAAAVDCRGIMSRLWFSLLLACAGCGGAAAPTVTAPVEPARPPAIVRWFGVALEGIKTQDPELKLRVGHDVGLGDENVLFVDYPKSLAEPAARDVWVEAEVTDWSRARALSFRIKPDLAVKLSVSFIDRNRVGYTSWIELTGEQWNDVQLTLDAFRPNPRLQPPDAKPGLPVDLTEVKAFGFAPEGGAPGRLALTSFRLTD